jgi:hypothetical protein
MTPRLEHSGCIEMHAAFQAQPSLDAQPLLGVRLVTERSQRSAKIWSTLKF